MGDCFDSATSGGFVEPRECSEQHQWETFAKLQHPAAEGESFPGDEVLHAWAFEACLPHFETFVGVSYPRSTLELLHFRPDEVGWSEGLRTVVCFLGHQDGSALAGSLRSSERDRSLNWSELAVGDCFDVVSGQSPLRGVSRRPCSEPHQHEAYGVLAYPAEEDDPYPGRDELLAWAEQHCAPQFEAYVGVPEDRSALDGWEAAPDIENWEAGARAVVCSLGSADGTPMTGSVRGSLR